MLRDFIGWVRSIYDPEEEKKGEAEPTSKNGDDDEKNDKVCPNTRRLQKS